MANIKKCWGTSGGLNQYRISLRDELVTGGALPAVPALRENPCSVSFNIYVDLIRCCKPQIQKGNCKRICLWW